VNDDAAPDEFHRLLEEHWDRILAATEPETRSALVQLVLDADRDPQEVQADLEDLLLDVLPADHPVLAYMRDRPLLQAAVDDGPTLVDRQAWLRQALRLDVQARPPDEPAPPPESGKSSRLDDQLQVEPGSPARRDLMAEVRQGLLQVPSYDGDEVASWVGETALIRLPTRDGTLRVPAFQFLGGPVGSGATAGTATLPAPIAPRPVVVETNRTLWADRDPWGASSWWVYRHAAIGAPPVDLLGGEHEDWLPALAQRLGED
jgi:hypothetical protein